MIKINRKQSGAIPYQYRENGLYVLLVSSRSGKNWIIPKGQIEPDLSAKKSALKEAFEEAGVTGQIHSRSIGKYRASGSSSPRKVVVYPLKVSKTHTKWTEDDFRRRKWFKVNDAIEKVSNDELKNVLKVFRKKFH